MIKYRKSQFHGLYGTTSCKSQQPK